MCDEKASARLDVALTERGLAPSRSRARSLIDAGLVYLNGKQATKASAPVFVTDEITVPERDHPYVGRGGLKLAEALKTFHVRPEGLVCLDVGASTGGFTDVLLQAGARHVYAVDVGTDQLDPSLRSDPRVSDMPGINARFLEASLFPEQPTLAVADVSFISLKLILPAVLPILGEHGRMITLIKPQFEAGRAAIGKHGIVSDPAIHRRVLKEISDFVLSLGWQVRAVIPSPVPGGDGNKEFLADIVRSGTQGAL